MLYGSLLVSISLSGMETVVWREKERARNRGVQINSLICLLGIMRMDKVPNARINQFVK